MPEDADMKDAVKLFETRARLLSKIQQALLSVKKDFESEKKELDKAFPVGSFFWGDSFPWPPPDSYLANSRHVKLRSASVTKC